MTPSSPHRLPSHLGGFVAHPLTRVVTRRLLIAIPLLFIVSVLTFVLVAFQPGNPTDGILGINGTPAQYKALQHSMGLDKPLPVQYLNWLRNALKGDLGTSLVTNESVSGEISQRLPVTVSLIFGALIVTALVGIPLGVFSAVRGGAVGRLVDAIGMLGVALPSFWLAVALVSLFAVKLGWFPAIGYVPLRKSPQQWFLSLVLPVAALSLASVGGIAKLTREAMLDVLASEHVRMSWAAGLSPASIVFHAFRNASIRVVTLFSLMFIGLLGGTVVVESVFSLPGLGGLAAGAVTSHDLPALQGVVVVFTILIVLVNLVTDLAYAWLDPRVRTG
jgi:peptide/nickel transport system permease protein